MRKIAESLPEPRAQLSQHRACRVIDMMRRVRQSSGLCTAVESLHNKG